MAWADELPRHPMPENALAKVDSSRKISYGWRRDRVSAGHAGESPE